VKLLNHQNGEVSFGVSQKSDRCYPRNIKTEYSCLRVILLKQNSATKKLEWVMGKTGNWARDTYLECDQLEKGTYFIYVQIDWYKLETPDPESQYLCFNSYGSGPVTFCDNECSTWSKKEVLS